MANKTEVTSTVASTGSPTSTSIVDTKSFTTTSFVLISATVLAIIVVALMVAMCWNTSPKKKQDPTSAVEGKLGRSPRRRRRREFGPVRILVGEIVGFRSIRFNFRQRQRERERLAVKEASESPWSNAQR
ncbi:hypothetical protein JCM3774_001889 [Rhodotorula dairenensis]